MATPNPIDQSAREAYQARFESLLPNFIDMAHNIANSFANEHFNNRAKALARLCNTNHSDYMKRLRAAQAH